MSNLNISSFPPSLQSHHYHFQSSHQPVPLSAPSYSQSQSQTAEWLNATQRNHPSTHGHAHSVPVNQANPAGTSVSVQSLQAMHSVHTYLRMEPHTPSQPEVSPQVRRFSISGDYPVRDVAAPSGHDGAILSQMQTSAQSQSFSQAQTQSPTYAQIDVDTPSQPLSQQLPHSPTHVGSGRGQHRYNPYPSSSPVQSHTSHGSPHEHHLKRSWQRNNGTTATSTHQISNEAALRDSNAPFMVDYQFMSLGDQQPSQTRNIPEDQQYNDY